MLYQGFIRHDHIDLCFCSDFFGTASKQQSASRLLNMALCRAQSADNGSSSIASQASIGQFISHNFNTQIFGQQTLNYTENSSLIYAADAVNRVYPSGEHPKRSADYQSVSQHCQ